MKANEIRDLTTAEIELKGKITERRAFQPSLPIGDWSIRKHSSHS